MLAEVVNLQNARAFLVSVKHFSHLVLYAAAGTKSPHLAGKTIDGHSVALIGCASLELAGPTRQRYPGRANLAAHADDDSSVIHRGCLASVLTRQGSQHRRQQRARFAMEQTSVERPKRQIKSPGWLLPDTDPTPSSSYIVSLPSTRA